jgi:hypothetical protein
MDPIIIADRLSTYFISQVIIDDKRAIGFHGLERKYKVSIHQYTGSQGYWIGTKIIFSDKTLVTFISFLKLEILIGVF